MADETEAERRSLIPEMPAELAARQAAGERVWSTAEFLGEFDVDGFAAPFVIVRRKSDGRRGTAMFTHHPRYYFGWEDGGDGVQ